MAQIRDYRKLAHDIICEVGGKENIVNATRCATRLRLVLKEEPEQAKEKVAAMAGVITVVENSGQFQVVIGTHVGEVYDAVAEELHLDTENLQVEQPKQSVMNKVIATMSAVFAPFVYILAAAGLLQGALILILSTYKTSSCITLLMQLLVRLFPAVCIFNSYILCFKYRIFSGLFLCFVIFQYFQSNVAQKQNCDNVDDRHTSHRNICQIPYQ